MGAVKKGMKEWKEGRGIIQLEVEGVTVEIDRKACTVRFLYDDGSRSLYILPKAAMKDDEVIQSMIRALKGEEIDENQDSRALASNKASNDESDNGGKE